MTNHPETPDDSAWADPSDPRVTDDDTAAPQQDSNLGQHYYTETPVTP